MFLFKRSKNFDLVLSEREGYLVILQKLNGYLKRSNHAGQAAVVEKLVDLIKNEDWEQFDKLINSVNMWGGSGAVWEVYVGNAVDAKEFERELVNLIDLMEATKILGKGIKPIRKIFKKLA